MCTILKNAFAGQFCFVDDQPKERYVRVLCSKESHGSVLHMFILCCIIVKDRCSASCMPHDNEDGQSVANHEDDQLPCSLTKD